MCEYWKLKTEIWNLCVKCLKFENLKSKMFEFWCVNIESRKLKFEICVWNVWNLKTWKLICLNWDVWIFKVENWNLYVKRLDFENWNVWIWMCEYWKSKTENWKLEKLFLRTWENSWCLSITPSIDFAHFNIRLSPLHSNAIDNSFIQLFERMFDHRHTAWGFQSKHKQLKTINKIGVVIWITLCSLDWVFTK
jgi:hypothetical protein